MTVRKGRIGIKLV
jgi:hypothetical protein